MCRRSWRRTSSRPTSARIPCHAIISHLPQRGPPPRAAGNTQGEVRSIPSSTASAARDSQTVLGPVLLSRRNSAPSRWSDQRSVRISDMRQPVRRRSRIAATARGWPSSRALKHSPRERISASDRKRSRPLRRYRRIPRQGLDPSSRKPMRSASRMMTDRTGMDRSAATGVARSDANHLATSSRVMSAIWRPANRGRICLRR